VFCIKVLRLCDIQASHLVFIGACNKGVGEGPVRAPRLMLALYDWGSAPCREFREALSFSPSAARVCLPISSISLVLMLPLWYYLAVCALSTPLAQLN